MTRPADVGATSGAVPKIVEYLRHERARDLPEPEMLALRVETFTSMAEQFDRWRDRDAAQAARDLASEAQEQLDALAVTSCSR